MELLAFNEQEVLPSGCVTLYVFDWDSTYAQADLLDELEGVCAGHARRPQRPRAVLVVGAVAVSATKKRQRSRFSSAHNVTVLIRATLRLKWNLP